MLARRPALWLLIAAAACQADPRPVDPPATPPIDAAVAPPAPAPAPAPASRGSTQLPSYDPSLGMHLDEATPYRVAPAPAGSSGSRVLEITLRSSPPGALAAVDGHDVGRTPILWRGPFTGREREFTFALAGFAIARYRFVPTANGVVHGTLAPIIHDQLVDAGVAPR